MIIGIPKEIKVEEKRIAIVPGGRRPWLRKGHKVLVEAGAGLGSGFDDAEYVRAGAEIVPDTENRLMPARDMVLKVKEPAFW